MGKTKDLSKDCKNIVLNLFKFFQLEKARGKPFYSPDNLIKGTCKAAGISYSSVYRVVNGIDLTQCFYNLLTSPLFYPFLRCLYIC
jgi:hypothetical protein